MVRASRCSLCCRCQPRHARGPVADRWNGLCLGTSSNARSGKGSSTRLSRWNANDPQECTSLSSQTERAIPLLLWTYLNTVVRCGWQRTPVEDLFCCHSHRPFQEFEYHTRCNKTRCNTSFRRHEPMRSRAGDEAYCQLHISLPPTWKSLSPRRTRAPQATACRAAA